MNFNKIIFATALAMLFSQKIATMEERFNYMRDGRATHLEDEENSKVANKLSQTILDSVDLEERLIASDALIKLFLEENEKMSSPLRPVENKLFYIALNTLDISVIKNIIQLFEDYKDIIKDISFIIEKIAQNAAFLEGAEIALDCLIRNKCHSELWSIEKYSHYTEIMISALNGLWKLGRSDLALTAAPFCDNLSVREFLLTLLVLNNQLEEIVSVMNPSRLRDYKVHYKHEKIKSYNHFDHSAYNEELLKALLSHPDRDLSSNIEEDRGSGQERNKNSLENLRSLSHALITRNFESVINMAINDSELYIREAALFALKYIQNIDALESIAERSTEIDIQELALKAIQEIKEAQEKEKLKAIAEQELKLRNDKYLKENCKTIKQTHFRNFKEALESFYSTQNFLAIATLAKKWGVDEKGKEERKEAFAALVKAYNEGFNVKALIENIAQQSLHEDTRELAKETLKNLDTLLSLFSCLNIKSN